MGTIMGADVRPTLNQLLQLTSVNTKPLLDVIDADIRNRDAVIRFGQRTVIQLIVIVGHHMAADPRDIIFDETSNFCPLRIIKCKQTCNRCFCSTASLVMLRVSQISIYYFDTDISIRIISAASLVIIDLFDVSLRTIMVLEGQFCISKQ